MDEPDFNIDDEIDNEQMYQDEYLAYEEQLMAEIVDVEDLDAPGAAVKDISPVVSSPVKEKDHTRDMLSPLHVLNQEHGTRKVPNKVFPSPDHINRPHSRGPNIQMLFSSTSLATQGEDIIKVISSSILKDRPPLGGEHLSLTLADGSRKYVLKRCHNNAIPNEYGVHQNLLSKSIQEIAAEAEARKIAKVAAAQEEKNNSAKIFSPGGHRVEEPPRDKVLWVDKYSPRSFSQLLSPEKTNREVLRAVKMWDKFVFDKELPPPSAAAAAFGRPTSTEEEDTSTSGMGQQDKRDKRPFHKIILLTGPPGTGKTTLAHIVAAHCGYRPVELNASDDRSVEALRDHLARSMGNTTLDDLGIGGSSSGNTEKTANRPNCVILDEIDGVDGRAPIDALVAIMKTPLQNAGGSGSTGGGKKKRKKGTFAMTRPVICICNDPFAPMLRELRAEAKVFAFSAPSEVRLVARLKHVCAAEGIPHVNPQALSALCQASGGDIRSAINTLQFVSLRCESDMKEKSSAAGGTGEMSHAIGRTLNRMLLSGLKDERQDVFELWRKIFCSKDNKVGAAARAIAAAGLNGSTPGASDGRNAVDVNAYRTARPNHAMEVFESVSGYGDNQLVTMGLFDNYLGVRYTDPTLQRTCTAADWLSFGDVLEGKLYSGDVGAHSTSGYVPSVASVLHLVCSTDARMQKITYPTKDRNVKFLKQQQQNILGQFFEGSVLKTQSTSSKQVCVLDVVPYLLDAMSLSGAVPVRAGPMQMLSVAEKDRVVDVAKKMVAFGLKYERNTTHSSAFKPSVRQQEALFQLEPAITRLIAFGEDYESTPRRAPTPPELLHNLYLEVRSLVLKASVDNGVHDEDDKDDENDMNIVDQETRTVDIAGPSVVEDASAKRNSSETILENDSNHPAKKAKTGNAETGFSGFFSKTKKNVKPSEAPQATGAAPKPKIFKNAVHFKFNQGFSNAVKRPVKMKEFLK